jgi:hypothetical protein
MDDQIKAELLGFIETLKSGADYVKGEAPAYVQEYLNWVFYGNLLLAAAFAIAINILWIVAIVVVKCERIHDDEGRNLFCWVLTAAILGLAMFPASEIVKVKVAPRVVILEHVSTLINGVK